MKPIPVVLSMIVITFATSAFARTGIPSSMPVSSTHRNHNAIDWSIQMVRELTNHDAIEITSRITNGSAAQFTFHTEPKTNVVRIDLSHMTSKGNKSTISRKVNISTPTPGTLRNQSGNYHPKPKEVVWSFQVDLRTLFGKLSPGSYTLQIHYPKSSFELRNTKLKIEDDLVSPPVTFAVSKTSLTEAAAGAKRSPITLTPDGRKGPHGALIGTLTNNSKDAIAFHAYMSFTKGDGKPGFKPPLSTTMGHSKFHPKYGWNSRPVGFCGTGLGSYQLKPGASVKVRLTSYSTLDGIYRYQLTYNIVGTKNNGTAISAPALISNFEGKGAKE